MNGICDVYFLEDLADLTLCMCVCEVLIPMEKFSPLNSSQYAKNSIKPNGEFPWSGKVRFHTFGLCDLYLLEMPTNFCSQPLNLDSSMEVLYFSGLPIAYRGIIFQWSPYSL